MTDSSTNHETEQTVESPGAMVRAGREKAGLSIADVAKELNIAADKLEAIERDQYHKLASEVFAQGYLRRYGKLVGVDDDALVARFNDYTARQRESNGAGAEREQESSTVNWSRWLVPAAIFLVAVAVLAFIFVRTASDQAKGPVVSGPEQEAVTAPEPAPAAEETPLENQTAPPDSQPEPETPAGPEAPDTAPAEESAEPAVTAPAEIPAEPLPDRGAEEPAATAEAAQQAREPAEQSGTGEEDVLSFAFSEDCWVEVSNASGTVIHAALANAGDSLMVEGQAPFSIMLGNARAVSLSYNGEAVTVNPRPGARTLRLRVGE